MKNTKLTFANQMDFKKWAEKKGLSSKWYYFDSISVVDAKDSCHCPDIPGVLANEKSTWEQAFSTISNYFKQKAK